MRVRLNAGLTFYSCLVYVFLIDLEIYKAGYVILWVGVVDGIKNLSLQQPGSINTIMLMEVS